MKKSNIVLFSGLIFILLCVIAAMIYIRAVLFVPPIKGDGNIIKSQIVTDYFEKIKISGDFNVNFTQDTLKHLSFSADSNLVEFISIDVKNKTLEIKSNRPIIPKNEITIEIKNLYLNEIDASGKAGFTTKNTLLSEKLIINANASSNVLINGIIDMITVRQNAGSKVTLIGKTHSIDIESNAGGEVDAFQMPANNVEVIANAGTRVKVNAINSLDVRANAGASVVYMGEPLSKNTRFSAGGSISKKEN